MSLDERVSRVIGSLYEGAHDETMWNEAIEDLVLVAGARWALVSVVDLKDRRFDRAHWLGATASSGFAKGVEEFSANPFRVDPSLQWATRHPNAGFCDSRDAVPGDYLADDYIRWNKARFGTTHWLVGYTPPAHDFIFGLSLHPHDGPLDARQDRLFRMVYGHAERAMEMHLRAPWATTACEPYLLLDRRGMVRLVSPAAEPLLTGDGLSLVRGELKASRSADQHRLAAAIRLAATALEEGGHGDAAPITRPSGLRPLIARVSPFPRPPSLFSAFAPAVLVRLIDPEATAPEHTSDLWMRVFGFTRAEARLALSLMASDDGLKGAADRLGIAHATARVHLARLFDKAGVRTQAQLTRLLTRIGG